MFAALMVSAAGCSTSSVLNTDKVEEQISKHVESTYQTRAQEAACPERPAKSGDMFECTARFEEQVMRFRVTQDDDEGNVTIDPAQAVIGIQTAEDDVARVIRSSWELPPPWIAAPSGSW